MPVLYSKTSIFFCSVQVVSIFKFILNILCRLSLLQYLFTYHFFHFDTTFIASSVYITFTAIAISTRTLNDCVIYTSSSPPPTYTHNMITKCIAQFEVMFYLFFILDKQSYLFCI